MITIKNVSIFDTKASVLVNPVNTQSIWGAGLAKQFKAFYPAAFYDHKKSNPKIGKLHIFTYHKDKVTIINFPTKTNPKLPSEYEYIEAGLKELTKYIIQTKPTTVAIPKLGCGLGKLDWRMVKQMMYQYLDIKDIKNNQTHIIICE